MKISGLAPSTQPGLRSVSRPRAAVPAARLLLRRGVHTPSPAAAQRTQQAPEGEARLSGGDEDAKNDGGGDAVRVGAPAIVAGSSPPAFRGHVLVAGAGPAGLTAALHFARRGFRVTVAERRPQPTEADRTTVHTYPMAVNPRAVAAIASAGAALPMLDTAAHYLGSASAADGRVLFSAVPEAAAGEGEGEEEEARLQRSFLVDQVGLCRELAAEAARQFPPEAGALTILWGRELAAVHFGARTATLAPPPRAQCSGEGESEPGAAPALEVRYDLLVGADGAGSRVRSLMEAARLPGFRTETLLESGKSYKTFLLPAAGHGAERVAGLESDAPRRRLYVYGQRGGGGGGGRGRAAKGRAGAPPPPRVVAYKREDGMVAGIVTEEAGWEPGALCAALGAAYPEMAPEWAAAIDVQAAARPPSSFSRIVRCSRLDGPGVVLVGDAAHAMTSSLGQGCNTALDSVAALARELDRCSGDLAALPAAYDAARRADAHAMQQLELMAVLAMQGRSYGSALSRMWAVAVLISASMLGLLGSRLLAALPLPGRRRSRRGAAAGAGGGGKGAAPNAAIFSAPWARQMQDPRYRPSRILMGMHALAALAMGLLALAAAAAGAGAAALLRAATGAVAGLGA